MTMPKFAANLTMMFNEVPFPQRFAAAAAAGFSAVEFLSPYEYPPADVAAWLQENKLECVLFNLPTGDWAGGERGLAALPGREEECRAGVARAIEYALALGTKRLHMMAGVMPAGTDPAAHHATYLANLRDAAHAVDQHGLMLLIEPINRRDIPGYFLHTQAQAHALREESGAANVKVQMDFYHAQIVEGDLATTFKQQLAHIGHVQIASVPGRNEPDEGEINYPYLFRLLDELGYDGWIGCEYRPRGRTGDGLGWLASARSAR
jgi:hydroxypyruvate isomerase